MSAILILFGIIALFYIAYFLDNVPPPNHNKDNKTNTINNSIPKSIESHEFLKWQSLFEKYKQLDIFTMIEKLASDKIPQKINSHIRQLYWDIKIHENQDNFESIQTKVYDLGQFIIDSLNGQAPYHIYFIFNHNQYQIKLKEYQHQEVMTVHHEKYQKINKNLNYLNKLIRDNPDLIFHFQHDIIDILTNEKLILEVEKLIV